MHAITEKKRHTAANAWGCDVTTMRQCFVIEEKDIGTKRPHYLGYNHKEYRILSSDVDRIIEVITSMDGSNYTCWSFM